MKNSAWHQKLWRKKLDNLPVKTTPDSGWQKMQTLLEKEMPAHPASAETTDKSYFKGWKVLRLLGYSLPVAAMITVVTYYAPQKALKHQPVKKHYHHKSDPTKISTLPAAIENVQLTDSDSIRLVNQASVIKLLKYNQIQNSDTSIAAGSTNSSAGDEHEPVMKEATAEFRGKLLPDEAVAGQIKQREVTKTVPDPHANGRGKNATNKINYRTAKSRKPGEIVTPDQNLIFGAGLNTSSRRQSFYVELTGTYAVSKRWLVNLGLSVNAYRKLSGQFSHSSYYRPDSLPPFTVTDSRKLLVLDIPLLLEYRVLNGLSVKAGPVISLPVRHSAVLTTLEPIADLRDTVYHSKEVNTALSDTRVNKINFGLTGGVSLQFGHFELNGSYQWLKPYKIQNNLGSYKVQYDSFRLGLGYRLK